MTTAFTFAAFTRSSLRMLVGTCLLAAGASAWAAFPDKPIRVVIGFPAGGPLDLHEAAFPIGMVTRTVLGRIGITLWRRAATEWRLEVPRSHAAYARDFLAEAARGMPGF